MINTSFVSFLLKLNLLILMGYGTVTLKFGECFESERNPGMIIQGTEDLVTMGHQEWLRSTFEELQMYTVRFDFSGKVSTPLDWSTIQYRVKGFTLIGYEQPRARVSLTKAKGFLVNMSLPVLKFRGKYTLDLYNGPWFEYSRKGAVSVTILDTTLEFRREMALNEDRNRINWTTPNCSASIKDIVVDLHDPVSNSLIVGIKWNEEIRLYQENFCTIMKSFTTFDIDLSYNFTNDIYLDNSLLHESEIYDGYIEDHLIAEVRYRGDEKRFTHLPQPLVLGKPTKVAIYRISDFLMNSFGYVVHNHNLLSFTYTQLDLPENRNHLLDTTCELECFGKLFPNAAARWPDSSVEISVTTAEPPYVQIAPGSFRAIFAFNIEAYARLTNDSAPMIFSIHLFTSALLDLNVKNNSIRFEIQNQDANVTTIESRIGDLLEDNLLVVISQAFQKVMVPLTKQFTIDGLDLDFSRWLFINEYEFNFMNGDLSLLVSSVDVKERKPYVDLTVKLLTPKHVELGHIFLFVIKP